MLALITTSRARTRRILGPSLLTLALLGSGLAATALASDQEAPKPRAVAADRIVILEDVTEGEAAAPASQWVTLSMPQDRDAGQDEGVKFGISLKAVDETLAVQLGIEADKAIVVERVAPGGAAEKAGLKPHDVIVKVDGKPGTLENLQSQRDKSGGKKPVALEIRRRARRMMIVVWGPKRPVGRELGVDARGLPGANRRAGPGRRGAIGLGGGGAGPSGPTRADMPLNRDGYLREIREMRDRLAKLEAMIRRDAEPGPQRRRVRTPEGASGKDRAAEQSKIKIEERRQADANRKELERREIEMRRRAMLEERRAVERKMAEAQRQVDERREHEARAMQRKAIAERLDALAARRATLMVELATLREALGRTENKKQKRAIEKNTRQLEEGMAEIEAEIQAMRQELKEAPPTRRRERSAIDPRAIQESRTRIEDMNAQVEALENMLVEVEAKGVKDEKRLLDRMKVEGAKTAELDRARSEIAEKSVQLSNLQTEVGRKRAELNEKSSILEARLAESELRLREAERKLAEAKAIRQKNEK